MDDASRRRVPGLVIEPISTGRAHPAPSKESGDPVLAEPMTLEDVYRDHVDFAWRVLRRQGVRPGDISDALQDVFLTVHRTLGNFEGRSSIKTWLYTICASVARDRRQRAHARHETARLDDVGELIDLRAAADARAEHNLRVMMLELALGEMDPSVSEVFVLFELEELTGQEISEVLAVPLGTVYARLQLARASFQRSVGRVEDGKRGAVRRRGERA
jgi:RNA polymerase sigma-70 factor (ECF subfamily)